MAKKPTAPSGTKNTYICSRCGTYRGVNRSYGMMICRRCLREVAETIGFRKYH
jgi:small subunit ribosomal protein S14